MDENESVGNNSFRCFKCGEFIPEGKDQCPKCGWNYESSEGTSNEALPFETLTAKERQNKHHVVTDQEEYFLDDDELHQQLKTGIISAQDYLKSPITNKSWRKFKNLPSYYEARGEPVPKPEELSQKKEIPPLIKEHMKQRRTAAIQTTLKQRKRKRKAFWIGVVTGFAIALIFGFFRRPETITANHEKVYKKPKVRR